MATEKRLIDANACPCIKCDRLGNCRPGLCTVFAEWWFSSVEAVEVVHGRWEDAYGGKYANPRYRCSVCKEKALYKFERDSLGNHRDVQALTPICPYCSAKLDGGNNNDV